MNHIANIPHNLNSSTKSMSILVVFFSMIVIASPVSAQPSEGETGIETATSLSSTHTPNQLMNRKLIKRGGVRKGEKAVSPEKKTARKFLPFRGTGPKKSNLEN